jgi:iron complex transport system ATP-binding protein
MSGLAARDLQVSLGGVSVLRDLTLAFEAGAVTAVVGPNGAGKSTFLACLAGLRTPDAGLATLDEGPVLGLAPRERARRIGFLEQTPQIAWAVDVRTLVGLGRTPYLGARGPTGEDQAAVEVAMAQAEVTALADRSVATLSGGERARVLIARALAGDPAWLLADEPMAGLDPGHQLDACDLFRRLAAQGRGVVVTLHDLTLAARVADRVVVLSRGAVLADGPPREALHPEVLARAYGVAARVSEGAAGPLVEVTGRLG